MTFDSARVALYTKIEALRAAWSAYTLLVEYDNRRTVDPALQTKPYLTVTIDYKDGFQRDISAQPGYRRLGVIRLQAIVKEGMGRREADELLEYLYPALHMSNAMSPLRTRGAIPLTAVPDLARNLVAYPVSIPFWMDD
jgi:hypothetical protein